MCFPPIYYLCILCIMSESAALSYFVDTNSPLLSASFYSDVVF